MNKYGQMALTHWQATDPSRVAELSDPAAFFEAMGLEMQTQVTNLASILAGSDRQGETFLQKVTRLTAARKQAEEVVMSQLAWIIDPSLPLDQAREEWEQTRPSDENLILWAERMQDCRIRCPPPWNWRNWRRLGAQRRVPAGARGDGAPPAGVHAGEPGDARRGGDDPLLPRAAVAPRFVPASQDDLGPSGAKARYRANVEAIQLIHDLNSTGRPASLEGQRVLARWSSWGAIPPEVFDDLKPEWDAERAELRELLSDDEWEAAERTTINAHYTDR